MNVHQDFSTREYIIPSIERTTRWAKRCVEAHQKKDTQGLFAIVQGGIYEDLRQKSLDELSEMDEHFFWLCYRWTCCW